MSIIKLVPIIKKEIWGTERWCCSVNNRGINTIASGIDKEQLLSKYLINNRTDISFQFKVITAKENLSVQVHPGLTNSAQSAGKNEAWYIIDAVRDSEILYGFTKDVTEEEVRERIKDGTITDIMNHLQVKNSDFIFVPSGTVHAIGRGIRLAEIQQDCDITYRLYDYKRVDCHGQERTLHIEEALQVLDRQKADLTKYVHKNVSDYKNGAFSFQMAEHGTQELSTGNRNQAVYCASGEGSVIANGEELPMQTGDSILVVKEPSIVIKSAGDIFMTAC